MGRWALQSRHERVRRQRDGVGEAVDRPLNSWVVRLLYLRFQSDLVLASERSNDGRE
jgi:hypothetical protein